MTSSADWLRATLQANFKPTTYAVVTAAIAGVLRSPEETFDISDLREVPVSLSSLKRGLRELRVAGLLDITPTISDFGKSGRSIYRLKLPPVSPPV